MTGQFSHCIGAFAALALLAGAANAEVAHRYSAACAAAKEILASSALGLKGPGDALTAVPPNLPPVSDDYIWAPKAWTGQIPPAALRRRWATKSHGSILACAGSRDTLPSGVEVASAQERPPEGRVYHAVEKPVLSADGKEALLLVDHRRRGLGGGLDIIYLVKSGGAWREAGRRAIALS